MKRIKHSGRSYVVLGDDARLGRDGKVRGRDGAVICNAASAVDEVRADLWESAAPKKKAKKKGAKNG